MYNKFPCYYPGDFNPPTKYHLNTMEWLLGRPEIGHVYVVIGNDDPNQLVQEKKVKLWEMLIRHSFSPNVSILKSKDDHALNEIKNSLGKKKETPFFVAMDEKMARNKDIQENYAEFPNFQIEIIPSQFNKSSKQMIQAVLDRDDKTIKSLVPQEFNDQAVSDYVNIMKQSNDPEAPDEKSPTIDYKTHYINKFNDGFWKGVFEPMVKEDISYAEATNDFDALQTVLDKKRDIAFLIKGNMNETNWLKIQEMIKEGGLKTMFVKGNEGDAYVIYRPGKEKDATELKDIAEKHGGYLKYDAPAEDTRRIGQLLSYKPNEIEDFIKKHSPKKESLNEIANTPYTLSSPKERKPSAFDVDVDYTFTTDNGREYYIRFASRWVGRNKKEDQKYNWATELTFFPSELKQTGDPGELGDENFGKILATVAEATSNFVKKYKPEYLFWKGIKTDQEIQKSKTSTVDITKRQRIYNMFMNREVSKLSGYKPMVGDKRSSVEYENEIPVNGADDIFKYPEQPTMYNAADAEKKLSKFKLSR